MVIFWIGSNFLMTTFWLNIFPKFTLPFSDKTLSLKKFSCTFYSPICLTFARPNHLLFYLFFCLFSLYPEKTTIRISRTIPKIPNLLFSWLKFCKLPIISTYVHFRSLHAIQILPSCMHLMFTLFLILICISQYAA